MLAAIMMVARGTHLGRPVTVRHAGVALAMVLVRVGEHAVGHGLAGDLVVAGAGWALMWHRSPVPARPKTCGR